MKTSWDVTTGVRLPVKKSVNPPIRIHDLAGRGRLAGSSCHVPGSGLCGTGWMSKDLKIMTKGIVYDEEEECRSWNRCSERI